jgi:hypothetical protein
MTRRLWRPVVVQVSARAVAEPVASEQAGSRGGDVWGDAEPPPPHTFRWRGRLFRVQEVLARWAEAETWWREPGAAGDGPTVLPRADRWVWRVEAVDQRAEQARASRESGRVLGGVYDLAFIPTSALWMVLRVID